MIFRRKNTEPIKVQKSRLYRSNTVDKSIVGSCLVSYRISQAVEAHIIVGKVTKPCIKDNVECIFDGKATKDIEAVIEAFF